MKQKSVFLMIAVLLGLRITTTAQTPPSYVPTDGLVGWWPFNGNANDESGNGNDGTVNGATLTEDRFGNAGNAYSFDQQTWNSGNGGDEIYIQYSPSLASSNLTVSVWAYRTSNGFPGQPQTILTRFEGGNDNPNGQTWGIGCNTAPNLSIVNIIKSPATDNNQDDLISIGPALGIEIWTNIIMTFNGTEFNQYIDGQLVASIPSSDFVINTLGNSGISIGIANQANGYWNPYHGTIDDIGIWNRALTPEEIAGLYYAAECTHDLTLAPDNSVSNLGSTVSITANTSDVNPVYTWQTDFGQGFQNVVDYGNYSGASTSTLTISDLQLINHNQPIRVISTSGICVDTSEVAFISLADTCITQVFDTIYITVTDTLIINFNPTGSNPLTYANTILMYPNPASDQLTINYGDFASLAGYSLKIFNAIGQEIHSATINQQLEVLQLGTWGGAGTYEVVIYNAQGVPVETRAIVLE
jgi:hypothetical protein